MTDDLRDLVVPLLADPPHVAPPVAELRARVDRRRARRARVVGTTSVAALVLLVAAVAVLPRSSELQAGSGDASSTTSTTTPPPFNPGPVRVVVSPTSAPRDAARTVAIRNDGATPYVTCGHAFDLFWWDGSSWIGVASRIGIAPDALVLPDYTPLPALIDCTATTTLDPGSSEQLYPLVLSNPVPRSVTGTTPRPTRGPLQLGWYELREPIESANVDAPALGRFEITPDGSTPGTTLPPIPADPDVVLTVTPERASATEDRVLTVANLGSRDFGCLQFELRRWDGEAFQPYAPLWIDGDEQVVLDDDVAIGAPTFDCFTPIVAPRETLSSPLRLGAPVWGPIDGEPARPAGTLLEPGWYELGGRGSVGRFEVTAPVPVVPGEASTVDLTDGAGLAAGPSTVIDLYPGPDLRPMEEVLPQRLVAVDDDTVALAWRGSCNEPADHVTITTTSAEVEIRLAPRPVRDQRLHRRARPVGRQLRPARRHRAAPAGRSSRGRSG